MLIQVQFVETPLFTKQIKAALSDEQYAELQSFMAENPEAGSVISGTGGVRKLRWSDPGSSRGKRGGHRVLYFYRESHEQFLMLMLYAKSDQVNLTQEQKQQLRRIVKTWR